MATAIFWPTQLTYQSRPIVNLLNFCVFHTILIRFGLEANIGLRTTWNEFWITTAIIWPTGLTNRSRPIVSLFNFYVLVQFGWNLVCGLLPPCYFPAPFHAPAPTLLLPGSSFCPASAVLLPCFFQVPIPHISSSSPVPAQLLPSFCPVLLISAQLCSCPVPALLLTYSCFSPALALLQPCSYPAPGPANPSLAVFIIIISALRLFVRGGFIRHGLWDSSGV